MKYKIKLIVPYLYFSAGCAGFLFLYMLLKKTFKNQEISILEIFLESVVFSLIFNLLYLFISKRLFYYEINEESITFRMFFKKCYKWSDIKALEIGQYAILTLNNGEVVKYKNTLQTKENERFIADLKSSGKIVLINGQ